MQTIENHQRVRKPFKIQIAVLIFLFALLNGIVLYHEIKSVAHNFIMENNRLTRVFFDIASERHVQTLKVFLDDIQQDSLLLHSFASKDRETLYRHTQNYFQRLKIISPHVNNIHFYEPDNRSFLRMHKPENYGDDLKEIRPIVEAVNKDKKIYHGFEVGRYGTFFRVVAPMHYNGQYIGAVEFGINLGSFIDELEKFNKSKNFIVFPYNKEMESQFSKGNLLDQHKLLKVGGYSVLMTKEGVEENELLSALSLISKEEKSLITDIGDEFYLISNSQNIRNFKGEAIGFVANISKIDPYMQKFKEGVLRIIFFGILSFFMLNMIIDKIFEHFLRLNDELSKKIFATELKLKTIAIKLNPHFLLNAMNNISNLIHTNPDEADTSLIKMSKLLRSYTDNDDMISLRQELQFAEDYFYIQNLRYKNINHFEKKVDKTLLHVSVPKFSLQLLIENAFKHAYDGKNPLLIRLKIFKKQNGEIIILMLDNGKGFRDLKEGFGLSNLRERLSLYSNGTLSYKSRCGATKFKIKLGETDDVHDH